MTKKFTPKWNKIGASISDFTIFEGEIDDFYTIGDMGERLGGVRIKGQNSTCLEKLMPSFMDDPIDLYFLSTICLTKKVRLLRTAGRGRSNYVSQGS